jgi:hypothetical protein
VPAVATLNCSGASTRSADDALPPLIGAFVDTRCPMENCNYLHILADGTYADLATGEIAAYVPPPGIWRAARTGCLTLIPMMPANADGLPQEMLPRRRSWCHKDGQYVLQVDSQDSILVFRPIAESELPPSRWQPAHVKPEEGVPAEPH